MNLKRALGTLGRDDKIDDVSELLSNPVAIGYIYGAPIKFADQFLPGIKPDRLEIFIDYSLQSAFNENALRKLKERFIALSRDRDQGIHEGVSLAMRDIQAVVSAWARGIDPSELPECYKISESPYS